MTLLAPSTLKQTKNEKKENCFRLLEIIIVRQIVKIYLIFATLEGANCLIYIPKYLFA